MILGLTSILARGVFAIEPHYAESQMQLVQNILKGKGPEANLEGVPVLSAAHTTHAGSWRIEEAPEGSIAIVPISGPITKTGGLCMYGTEDMVAWIERADRLPNIDSIVLKIDSPGGEVFGTKTLSDAVANTKKPIVAFVNDGMCASAAYYIACKADQIFASQPTDRIGSIGVFTTLVDYSGFWKKNKIEVQHIYSPKSPEKNKAWNEAMKGNLALMESDLLQIDEVFMNQVREGRGEKLNELALEGGTFTAGKAQEMGLIDGIKSFDEVLQYCEKTAGKSITVQL